jgi:hypothetical protein
MTIPPELQIKRCGRFKMVGMTAKEIDAIRLITLVQLKPNSKLQQN